MSAPHVPPPLDQVGQRPFSFYPPILGIEQNEWYFRRATWSEALVFNPKTNTEVWVPRRFLGEVSRIDEPVVIVGLLKELEYRSGTVFPHERRVIEIPKAVNFPPPRSEDAGEAPRPAPVVGMRLEGGAESRVGRLLIGMIAFGIIACIAVVIVLRDGGTRVSYTPVVQNDLGFTGNDDEFSVKNKLGPPAEDRWQSDRGEMQFHVMGYPQQGVYVILMGNDRKAARYIGMMDKNWTVVHSTTADTRTLLRKLKKF